MEEYNVVYGQKSSLSLSLVISLIGGGIVASSGTMSSSVEDLPPASAAPATGSVAAGTLDEKRAAATAEAYANFRFADTGLPKWDGTYTNCLNGTTFAVKTPSDFAYALQHAGDKSGLAINILADIDMNGEEYNFTDITIWQDVNVYGNGHTIYNLRIARDGKSGLADIAYRCSFENILFANAYIKGDDYVGLVAAYQGASSYRNVEVRDSIFSGKAFVGVLQGRNWGDRDAQDVLRINYCRSLRNAVIATGEHCGGLLGRVGTVIAEDSYSDECQVISNMGHSGGFVSCGGGSVSFTRCWANNTIYGEKEVGGFSSGVHVGGATYTDCFTSGTIEGNEHLGGFAAESGMNLNSSNDAAPLYYDQANYVYTNCYSTTNVGMNYSGSDLGGFIGRCYRAEIYRCYAAGEVGSVDTDLDADTVLGGFWGSVDYTNGYTRPRNYCYYDMQSTAMKNKWIGNYEKLALVRQPNGDLVAGNKGSDISGLTTRQFLRGDALFPSGYVYSTGLYPQIASLANSNDVKVRAASAASATAVLCDTWDDLNSGSFDTVRDIIRPTALSSSVPFSSVPKFSSAYVADKHITDITWKTDANTSVFDDTSPVISLTDSAPYYTVSTTPGIEWFTATLTYTDDAGNTATGTRRLRLIPTATLSVGRDARVDAYQDESRTDEFNHGDDFKTTVLDATTLRDYLLDDKQNADALLDFPASATHSGSTISVNVSLPFNKKTTSAKIEANVSFGNGDSLPADIAEEILDKVSGMRKFEIDDLGTYDISYKVSVPDGRYLMASRQVIVATQWSVVYHYNYTGIVGSKVIYPESIYAYTGSLADYNGFDYTAPYDGIAPVRDGHSFAYWSLDEEGMKPVSQMWFDTYEEIYGTVDSNLELYAQWNREGGTHTLTIDPKQGTYNDDNAPTQIKGTAGNKVLITEATPALDSREGFVDWMTEQGSTGILIDASNGQERVWVYIFGDGNGYISAQYARNIFEVKWFDDVDGTLISTELVAAGTPAHVPHHPPRHTGRVFAGFDHMRWECVEEDMEVRLLYAPYIYELPYDTDSLVNQCIIDYPDKK